MHRSLARYSAPASFVHAPFWAAFITTMVGFKLSVHTTVPSGAEEDGFKPAKRAGKQKAGGFHDSHFLGTGGHSALEDRKGGRYRVLQCTSCIRPENERGNEERGEQGSGPESTHRKPRRS